MKKLNFHGLYITRAVFCKNKGSILIVTFWLLIILMLVGIALSYQVGLELKLQEYQIVKTKLHYMAKAAARIAISEVVKDTNEYDSLNESWSNNPALFNEHVFGDGLFILSNTLKDGAKERILYGLVDEERKININTCTEEVLIKLPGMTDELCDSILDWRDADSIAQRLGAEDSYYLQHGYPHGCKDSFFETVEEVLMVKGMTTAIFSKIKDFITVYGQGKININTAPREVLNAFGLNRELIDLIMYFRRGADGEIGTQDDGVFRNLSDIKLKLNNIRKLTAEEIQRIDNVLQKNLITVKSENFKADITVKLLQKNNLLKVSAVVSRDVSKQKEPIKYWNEY